MCARTSVSVTVVCIVFPGFEYEDAKELIDLMAKTEYHQFFIDHMMVEELGKKVPDPDDSPLKAGIAMFVAFCVFGSIPALSYIVYYIGNGKDMDEQFGVSCVMTAAGLFLLGWIQVRRCAGAAVPV